MCEDGNDRTVREDIRRSAASGRSPGSSSPAGPQEDQPGEVELHFEATDPTRRTPAMRCAVEIEAKERGRVAAIRRNTDKSGPTRAPTADHREHRSNAVNSRTTGRVKVARPTERADHHRISDKGVGIERRAAQCFNAFGRASGRQPAVRRHRLGWHRKAQRNDQHARRDERGQGEGGTFRLKARLAATPDGRAGAAPAEGNRETPAHPGVEETTTRCF